MEISAKNILVLGQGGREHAMVVACHRSPNCEQLFAAPGSDAIFQLAEKADIDPDSHDEVIAFCQHAGIDLVIIGPEAYLVTGLADSLRSKDIAVFGPGAQGAELEGSKIAAKAFMDRHNLPTARWERHDSLAKALAALESWGSLPVIKADGLAAGKGVTVPATMDEARTALRQALEENAFGDAGARVLLEDRLQGEEVSWIAITDGHDIVSFPPAQDHKRIFDGDNGPNTGGMGAYAPTTLVDDVLRETILQDVVHPFVKGLQADNIPFRGAIYFGLMIDNGKPYLLEFNVRFGDPECQILLDGLESDFVELCWTAATAQLNQCFFAWQAATSCIVVAASRGYPESSSKGDRITGIETSSKESKSDPRIIHAGTRLRDGNWETAGGRVLGALGRGATIKQAVDNAYEVMKSIRFEGMQIRKDIGQREIKRQQTNTDQIS